ncbi:HNH endonuclease family protein [Streptomyces microflavus]|uniref:HNH endonuclease family protein n=1 Tax=Streptomyces microflavus TaxID=1919 RepID=UPI0033C062CE
MTRRPLLPLAAALLALTLAACNPQTADDDPKQPAAPTPTTSAAPTGAPGGPGTGALSLTDAIAEMPKGEEKRDGYERDSFKHWIDEDQDGCPTRAEVLIEEATTKPEQGERCTLTGGVWTSSYDGVEVTDAKRLDIDHMVPLAEAWDSGAHAWSDKRRQAYANDLTAPRSLIAVTAKTNRSKGDKDPADWLPPAPDAHCTYAADWTGTKLRWQLNADDAERTALLDLAGRCPNTVVEYEPAA